MSKPLFEYPVRNATLSAHLRKPGLLLVGRYPPPYGGISVHIKRVRDLLAADWDVWVLDPYDVQDDGGDDSGVIRAGPAGIALPLRLLRVLRLRRFDIVHFHVSAMSRFAVAGVPLLLVTRLFALKRVLTIHSGSFRRSNPGLLSRMLIRSVFWMTDHVIAVGSDLRDHLLSAYHCREDATSVIPAFIPSQAQCPAYLADWIGEATRSGKRVIVSSGYGLRYYGFHDLVRALSARTDPGDLVLLICVYHQIDEAYLDELRPRDLGFELRIERNLTPEAFCGALSLSDLYIRATDRDGDAVAVREASYFGVPVLASDCVGRPPGVEVFATGDLDDLGRALCVMLNSPVERNRGDSAQAVGPLEIEMLYESLLEN